MASANDIFIHLTVPQIVKLNDEYKSQVTRAKQDLHNLVGTKYRDLIRIAEDIDAMTQLTEEVDSKLSDLSYKQTRFVNFSTKNPYAKFNTQIRQSQVKQSREQSKAIILNYLINKKLVAFDLQILNNKIARNSLLVYFAKVYYSIEFIFQDILSTNPHLKATFEGLKQNFIHFLEQKLSTYNPSTETFLSNDFNNKSNTHELSITDIVQPGKQAPTLESDDFDFFDDDELDNLASSADTIADDDTEDLMQNYHLSYSNSSPQIVTYLISYIIINHTNPELNTLSKILEKFISLRLSYLQELIKELVPNSPEILVNIKFFRLLKYVENTCDFVEKYFESKNLVPSDLFKLLKKYSSPWKATEIIGFHHWFESDEVKLNQDVYLINLPQSSLSAAHESLSSLSTFISSLLQGIFDAFKNSKDPLAILTNHLIVFHNFIVSLAKVEISCAANGKTCKLLALTSSTGLVDSVLQMVTSNISNTFYEYCQRLSTEGIDKNILDEIKALFSSNENKPSKSSMGMFSAGLVDFIDSEINEYINYIRDSSVSASFSTEDGFPSEVIMKKINDWFDSCISLTYFLETDKVKTSNRKHVTLAFVHLVNFMGRKFDELNDKTLSWGKFSQSVLLEKFNQLNTEINDQFWGQISQFADEIRKFTESKTESLHNSYFLLQISIIFKRRVQQHESESHKQKVIESLDKSLETLYSKIIERIPEDKTIEEITYLESLDKVLTTITNDTEASYDIPTRPSLRLSSLLYELSSKFLSPGPDDEAYEYTKCFIFTDVSGKDIFTKLKNDWLRTKLIDSLILQKLPSSDSKFSADQSKLVFADLVYLSCFLTSDTSSEIVKSSLAKINEVSESQISESTSQTITKGIADYYKSNKNLYLPLLIN